MLKNEVKRLVNKDDRVLIGAFLVIILTVVSFSLTSITGFDIADARSLSSDLDEAVVSVSPSVFAKPNQYNPGLGYINVHVDLPRNGIYSEGVVYKVGPTYKTPKVRSNKICTNRGAGNTNKCLGKETDFALKLPGSLGDGDYLVCVYQCANLYNCARQENQIEVCSSFTIV